MAAAFSDSSMAPGVGNTLKYLGNYNRYHYEIFAMMLDAYPDLTWGTKSEKTVILKNPILQN